MPIIALIIALTLGGGTVAVAQNDNPGDALYGVKITSEAVADIAVTVATGNESEISFKEKLAARRAGELEVLRQRMGSVQEKKKIVLMNNIERTADRLEDNVDRISVRIKKLQIQNTEDALELAARLSAKSEVYQGVMAEIETNPDIVSELKEKMAAGQISMERFRAKTRAAESEVKKRHLSEVGLENSAKGRVKAAENKMEVAIKMREKAVSIIERIEDEDKKLAMKEEFNQRDAFYQDGVKFTTDARAFLDSQQWEEAIINADHAFKVFIQFVSPLGHKIRRVDVDIDAGGESVDEEPEQEGMRRKAEMEFSRAFTRMSKLQLHAGQLNVEIPSELLEKFEIAVRQAKAEYNKGAYSEAVDIVIQNGRVVLDAIEAAINQTRNSGETESEVEDQIDIQSAIDKGWKELSDVGARVFRVKEAGNALPADVDTLMRTAKELLSSAEQTWGEQNKSDARNALHTANKALKRVSGMLDLSSRKFGELTQSQAESKIRANHALFQARAAHTELQNYALKFNSSFPNLKMSPSAVVVERGSAMLRMAQKYYDDKDFKASISSANDAEKVFREEFQDFLRKTQNAFNKGTEQVDVVPEIDNIESDDQPEILEKKKKLLEKKEEQTSKPAERNFAKEMAVAAQLRARTAFQKYMTQIDELGKEKVTLYMGRADQSMDAGDYSSAHKYYAEVVDVINAAVARISSGQSLPGSN